MEVTIMSTMRTTQDHVVPHAAFDTDRTAPRVDGWLRAVAHLWPLGVARIVFTDVGRSFRIDAFLAPRLEDAAARGNRLGSLLQWLV